MWFSQLLPGLVQVDAPVPLGGTSNHFRRERLVEVGAWDPFNVTEDADLGIRLHRAGYRTAVMESTTLEEANSDFVNRVKQRSRWYKGYLQTWLVHMRRPRRLWHELGPGAFLRFNLFVGGTPLLALLNPVFWIMCIVWFVGHPGFVLHLFPAPVYYASLACWLGGNFVFTYMCVLTALELDQTDLAIASLFTPLYWVMMSVAGAKALMQLAFAPSYWEKTHHGLDAPVRPVTTPVV
jgi:cellulose synthase/poly-beta-1,6-N-acetylglucosamine synthase-like glycosyltransferase